VAGTAFKCSLHNVKIKFFRSLNSIIGKLGSNAPVDVTISLVNAFCNPILLYGLESLRLSMANINSISYPYNSVYMKLFSTFDKNVTTLCQFFTGQLPLSYLLDLRALNFYTRLNVEGSNPASILFRWFGKQEHSDIYVKYGISIGHTSNLKSSFYNCFSNYAKSLM